MADRDDVDKSTSTKRKWSRPIFLGIETKYKHSPKKSDVPSSTAAIEALSNDWSSCLSTKGTHVLAHTHGVSLFHSRIGENFVSCTVSGSFVFLSESMCRWILEAEFTCVFCMNGPAGNGTPRKGLGGGAAGVVPLPLAAANAIISMKPGGNW